MKYQDRLDLQHTISKLETNNFDYKDIKSILIDLREYSEHKSDFREISHFVAHKERDQGLVHSNVEGYFCNLYMSHLIQNMGYQWDYSKQPEPFVGRALLFRAEQAPNEFYQKYKIQKGKFLQQVKENLPQVRKENFQWSESEKFYNIINALDTYTIKPLFNSKILVESFLKELKRNNFKFDQTKIDTNRLILIIMTLLHETEYHSTILKRKIGKLSISLASTVNETGAIQLYTELDPFTHEQDFQGLKFSQSLQYKLPLITSDLHAKDWCTNSLITYFENQHLYENEVNIYLNDEMKLDINYSS